jgi:hypothetical protein
VPESVGFFSPRRMSSKCFLAFALSSAIFWNLPIAGLVYLRVGLGLHGEGMRRAGLR